MGVGLCRFCNGNRAVATGAVVREINFMVYTFCATLWFMGSAVWATMHLPQGT